MDSWAVEWQKCGDKNTNTNTCLADSSIKSKERLRSRITSLEDK